MVRNCMVSVWGAVALQSQWTLKLELFEWVGLIASVAAGILFFSKGPALDAYVGQPGYHWTMLFVVVRIYANFIPYALAVGAIAMILLSVYVKRVKRDSLQRLVYAVRVFLAYCLLLIVFRVVNFYVPLLTPGLKDTAVQRMDSFVFGKQVSDWLQPLAWKPLTYGLTGAYVSWFWLLFATIAILAWKNRQAASEYVFATLLAFYVGYISYILIPVIGPGYTLHYAVTLGAIAPTYTTDTLRIARDCFPSLHTATSVLMCIYIGRYHRRFLVFYVPMAITIVFATLYLRIHYGMDDIAGAALAVIVSQFAPVPFQWWQGKRTNREKMAIPVAHAR